MPEKMAPTRATFIKNLCEPPGTPRGDTALIQLIDLYGPYILSFLDKHNIVSGADQEQLLFAVFERARHAVRRFEPRREGSFRAWLQTIALNEIRRLHKRRNGAVNVDLPASSLEEGETPDSDEPRHEFNPNFRRCLAEILTEEQHEVLERRVLGNERLVDIAGDMKKSPGAVLKLFKRAKEKVLQHAELFQLAIADHNESSTGVHG